MNERQLSAERLRARLAAIEQPHLEWIDGLRELLAVQDSRQRRKTWKDILDEAEYNRWAVLSDLYEQIEQSMS
jgi:hypothetical protein